MTSHSPCEACKVTGLPIFPIRYTVFPKTVPRQLPSGITGKGITDVALARSSYGVRIMREGWLYLFYEKGARGVNYWEAYAISQKGRFRKCPMPLAVSALNPPTPDACDTSASPNRSDIIVIERPEKCGTVWVAFSEFQWHAGTFDNYKNDTALRGKRMQSIHPADWISFGSDASGHAIRASTGAIERVLEYNPGFDANRLQPQNPYKISTDDRGGFDENGVSAVYTRYPLQIRQMTPLEASKQLLQVMTDAGQNPQGAPRPPMVLALWDGVGNVHELNGFRNDAAGMLTHYMAENATQIDAIGCISAAENAVRAGAVESKSQLRSSLRAGWEAFLSSGGGSMDGIPVAPPPTTPEEDAATEKRIADAGVISPSEAKKLGDAAWPKYEKEIDRTKMNAFETHYKLLQTMTINLQSDRAADVGEWLKAPVFLATLNDYRDNDICDGRAFEGVIAEAFLGMPSEATGAAIVSAYFNNMDPTDDNSLLWRAFALNQGPAKIELKDLLSTAKASKTDSLDPELEKLAPAVTKIKTAVDKMTSFVKAVKDAAERDALKERITLPERLTGAIGIDRLAVTLGPDIIKFSGAGFAGATVGGYILQAASVLRIGVTSADTVGLIKDAMKYDATILDRFNKVYKPMRARGIPAKTAYFTALATVQSDENYADLVKQKELHLTYSSDGEKARFAIKMAGLMAIFQVISLLCATAKADKTGEDYAMIVTSSLATISVLLQVPTDAMKARFGDAVKYSISNMKAVSGFLGGISAAVSLALDISRMNNDTTNNPAAGVIFGAKLFLTGWTISTTLITAFSYAAPYVLSVVGRGRLAFLATIHVTVANASAQSAMAKKLAGTAGEAVSDAAKKSSISYAGRSAARVAATEIGVEVVTVEGAGLLIARIALFAAGWEVAIAVTVIGLLYSYFKNDDLQAWLIESPFGASPKNPLDEAAIAHKNFEKALSTI